jgi:thiol-disulfide isomerase/thioredoxin
MINIIKLLLFIAFVLLTIGLSGQSTAKKIVKVIPQLSIYNINGDTTNLKTITDGKITFIDFWFIPCGPCFNEMNMLHKLYAKYKDNLNVSFLTITLTDSAFARPLIENRNTPVNETYDYFKSLAQLDSFKLPVYFIKNGISKMISFKKEKGNVFQGHGEPRVKDQSLYPANVFGFSAYPTIFIFDKGGKVIYTKTGFMKETEDKQQKNIEAIINDKL